MRPGRWLLFVLLAAAAPVASADRGACEGRFTILQINDVYKVEGLEGGRVGGLARVRTLRRSLEAEGRAVLVLHAGDFLFPSVMGKYLKARPMIRCLNLLDGDPAAFDPRLVVTFGNHEFDDKDPGVVLGRIAQSDFPWVSSNVLYKSGGAGEGEPLSRRLTNVHDTLLVDVGGVRVGIFGLTIDAQPRDYVAYGYDEPRRRATVRRAVRSLRARGARVVVALTHQDMDEDVRLAETFPGIDLVVGGHEHVYDVRRAGRTFVTKADADAKTAVVIDVVVPARGDPVVAPRRVALEDPIAKDPTLEAAVAESLAEMAKAIRERTGLDPMEAVATTEHALEGVEPAIRNRETALGNFLADVARDRMKADVALVNGGAIRINDDVPAGGPVRRYDLEGIFYFDNALVAFELTGAELRDVLRASLAKAGRGDGGFLQVSGVRVGPDRVEVRARDGAAFEPLDPARRYVVATLDYLHENGAREGYPIFAKGTGGTSPPLLDRGPPVTWRRATEEAIAALPGRRITTSIEGRIAGAGR
jgi:5'-nucleotidase